jgi:hypothetical protein
MFLAKDLKVSLYNRGMYRDSFLLKTEAELEGCAAWQRIPRAPKAVRGKKCSP